VETPDGFVVKAASPGGPDAVPSAHAYGVQLRDALVENGRFFADGAHLGLTEHHLRASPSSAVMVMRGHTSDRRVGWKTTDGRTLKALQEETTPARPAAPDLEAGGVGA
jgi:hypothetical protein